QSFDNFHFAQATQEVVKLVSAFAEAYDRFRGRFSKLGEELGKLEDLYHDIADKSFRQLDSAVAKIEKVRRGGASADPEAPSALPHKADALPASREGDAV